MSHRDELHTFIYTTLFNKAHNLLKTYPFWLYILFWLLWINTFTKVSQVATPSCFSKLRYEIQKETHRVLWLMYNFYKLFLFNLIVSSWRSTIRRRHKWVRRRQFRFVKRVTTTRHFSLFLLMSLFMLIEMVTPHKPLTTRRALKSLFTGMRAYVTLQLIATSKTLTTE